MEGDRAPFWPPFSSRILGQYPAAPCSPGTFGLLKEKTKGQQLKGKIVSALFHTFFGNFPHIFTLFSEFSEFFLQDFFLSVKGFTAVLVQR